ncbi:hypothetical protein TB1_002021 [Malus domestica]
MSAMVANDSGGPKFSASQHQYGGLPSGASEHNSGSSGGYRSFYNNKKGKGRSNQGYRYPPPNPRQQFSAHGSHPAPVFSGVLGSFPSQYLGHSSPQQVPCQLCNQLGHTAPFCHSKPLERQGCQICGKRNHTTWYCFFNDKGPNFGGPNYPHMSSNAYAPSAPPQSNFQALHTVSSPSPSATTSHHQPQIWLTDSGATNHMTTDLSNLSLASPYPSNETVQTANGAGLEISHIGSSIIQTPVQPLKLNSILYVPKLSHNLLSVHRICLDNNCWLVFDAFCFWIQDKATGRILYKGQCSNGLYPIPSLVDPHSLPSYGNSKDFALLGQLVSSNLWHNRLGHPSNNVASLMLSRSHISCTKDSAPMLCHSCLEGKFTKLPFQSSEHKSVIPFEIVHSDLWGPSPCNSIDGYKYYVTLIDECTRYCWLFPLVNKSDFFETFVVFYSFVHTQFSASIKILQTDGGGEYSSNKLTNFLHSKGILHHKSCPHTPEQNGLAERKHRHIVETTVTLLQSAKLPSSFWTFACQVAVYLINRMPTPVLKQCSPFEMLFGTPPLLTHLKVFGCSCFPLLRPYIQSKLQAKTIECVFLGYASNYKGFICFDVLKGRFYISRHVVFDESRFPYPHLSLLPKHHPVPSSFSQSSSPLPFTTLDNLLVPTPPSPSSSPSHSFSTEIISSPSVSSQSITATTSGAPPLPVDSDFGPDLLPVVLPIVPLNLHPMQTRSKNGIFKKKVFLSHVADSSNVDLTLVEPATFKSAMKVPVWFHAMQEEIDALHHQHTWSLVHLPPNKNLVGCKWVFKLKKNSDGTVARHKARLVAKGFSQEPGLDYGETFSPVVKPTTVRLVLALAAHFNWNLRQLDVKNAFLHGFLTEEVYMAQPPGFGDAAHPELVCKLHKSLYGLKQAPRAWNDRFTSFLPSLGFQATYSDSSLFVKTVGSDIVVLLLYVDDIIITGSSTHLIQQVIHSLTAEFDIKDLGVLHYFLGIQVTKTAQGLFLSQSKYITDLLQKVEMMESKACDTPCLPNNRLLKDDGTPYNNPTVYRSIVGALQYLTFTRPDIAFSVHQVCQFMQSPMVSHFTAVKRILRYLKGTLSVGMAYTRGDLTLKAFSDADWAGDPNDRRSTTGLVIFLGNNPISWSSKKQNTVSRSSTEAEYRAMSTTSAELDWIQQVLDFMHIKSAPTPVLFCDNLSAIALSFNPVQHQRTKHIEIDVHFVRERVAKKQLVVQFVSSREQFADILTKGLSAPLFRSHCFNLMLGSSTHEFEGACKDIDIDSG